MTNIRRMMSHKKVTVKVEIFDTWEFYVLHSLLAIIQWLEIPPRVFSRKYTISYLIEKFNFTLSAQLYK